MLKTIKAKVKYWLWRFDILKRCPYCGATMTKHGFEPDERYTCDNKECEFNAD